MYFLLKSHLFSKVSDPLACVCLSLWHYVQPGPRFQLPVVRSGKEPGCSGIVTVLDNILFNRRAQGIVFVNFFQFLTLDFLQRQVFFQRKH